MAENERVKLEMQILKFDFFIISASIYAISLLMGIKNSKIN
jgi:hypothetical protein